MITITFFLCVLANQAAGQTKDILPARILSRQTTIGEDSDLYLTCSLFGAKRESSLIYVYLVKDNVGFKTMAHKHDQNDITFGIFAVAPDHSGSYSCVYSLYNHTLSKVANRGVNVIEIQVIATFLPADISIVGQSSVWEGDHVVFRCAVSHVLQTVGNCQLINSYLKINNTVLSVRAFDVAGMVATFTIPGAVLEDSGHYSCVVLPSKCLQEKEKTIQGRNTVFLRVKGYWSPGEIIKVLIPVLVLGLFLLWISKKQGLISSQIKLTEHACGDVLEEQQEQMEHREGQESEVDSFSYEEAEESCNDAPSEDSPPPEFDLEEYSVICDDV